MLRYKGGKDLYHFFIVVSKCPPLPQLTAGVVDAHLPSRKQCPFAFLQELASGRKKYLLRQHVPSFHMPTWPELAVSKLWPIVQTDAAFMPYFPSKLPVGKVPEKHFFWGILQAIKPGYVKCLMKDAIESRNKLPE